MLYRPDVALLDVLHDDRTRRLGRAGTTRRRRADELDGSAGAAARAIGVRRHREV